ncbi:uncharacterized protein [Diadema setosum]|uniref:uncharacterized protein n=1 Tax=Diadema setosum TaxID=31175 RepID=UPI003B3AF743
MSDDRFIIAAEEDKDYGRATVERFFREHCRASLERLGRLDLDCWAVTRRVVSFLTKAAPNSAPKRVRWSVVNPFADPRSDPEDNRISHWVIEWNGRVVDATVLQFYDLGDLLSAEGQAAFKRRCYCEAGTVMAFRGCSEIHPPWIRATIAGGRAYEDFARNILASPYFYGRERDHPLFVHAKVIRPRIK